MKDFWDTLQSIRTEAAIHHVWNKTTYRVQDKLPICMHTAADVVARRQVIVHEHEQHVRYGLKFKINWQGLTPLFRKHSDA